MSNCDFNYDLDQILTRKERKIEFSKNEKKGFEKLNEIEMSSCLQRAQIQAELDNALRQLEIETRKCIKRRKMRQNSGIVII